jgi:hypothetical protein
MRWQAAVYLLAALALLRVPLTLYFQKDRQATRLPGTRQIALRDAGREPSGLPH